jgi:hypothetical protein
MSRSRLLPAPGTRISAGMRAYSIPFLLAPLLLILVLAPLGLPGAAMAQTRPAKPVHAPHAARSSPPKAIGTYEDWEAATHAEAGQTVCYAFTRAQSSTPALPGRDQVVLTVTQRQALRDAVAISAGFTYAANAAVTVQVDKVVLDFYTAGRSAFARDGHAAVLAFEKGAKAIAHSPGPRNTQVVDSFSLKGFSLAYDAINKACPAK